MIYIPEKEEYLRKKNLTTEYSRAFFKNEKDYGDKIMVFGSSLSLHGFVVNENSVFGFGNNRTFNLGVGHNRTSTELTEIQHLDSKKIRKIACGHDHSIFLISKHIYGCGDNSKAQICSSNITDKGKRPTRIKVVSCHEDLEIIDIFAGFHHNFVLTASLDVYGFGYNDKGELGVGDMKNRESPTKIIFSEKIISISCGCFSSSFISFKGNIFVTGYNNYSQLGIGKNLRFTRSRVVIPQKLDFFKTKRVLQISCGWNHVEYLTSDNRVYGVGYNNSGMLGLGNRNRTESPTLVKSLKDVKFVKCGGYQTLFVTKTEMRVCGYNDYGQLGLGHRKTEFSPTLFSIKRRKEKKKIVHSLMMYLSSLYFTEDNEIYGCGYNTHGELFCGNLLNQQFLVKIEADLKIKKFKRYNRVRMEEFIERFDFLLEKKKNKISFLV